jgi:surfeit locus 1 family protein
MSSHDHAATPGQPGRGGVSLFLVLPALLLVVLFAGLGTWQVFRLQWKLDLIARVDARVHAAPSAPPDKARWGGITPESDEYRRVALTGAYLYDLTTPVQALTEEGSGYWLLTPLCLEDGQIILVNRGFIATDPGAPTRYAPLRASADACAHAGPRTSVTGLLRISEPGGMFTRTNDPGANRWFSRNVAQIAAARGLNGVAPYFVDAAAGQNPPGSPDQPVGGMTVVNFHNSHLAYAITWYALALMVAGALWWVARGPGARTGSDERHD